MGRTANYFASIRFKMKRNQSAYVQKEVSYDSAVNFLNLNGNLSITTQQFLMKFQFFWCFTSLASSLLFRFWYLWAPWDEFDPYFFMATIAWLLHIGTKPTKHSFINTFLIVYY